MWSNGYKSHVLIYRINYKLIIVLMDQMTQFIINLYGYFKNNEHTLLLPLSHINDKREENNVCLLLYF